MYVVHVLYVMALGIAGGAAWWHHQRLVRALHTTKQYFQEREAAYKKEQDRTHDQIDKRMYELAILKELGERVGYSLNVQNIIDIISGSLHQFLRYSIVSYMLLEPERIIFKVHIEESVPRSFIDDVRNRMLTSLSVLLDKEL